MDTRISHRRLLNELIAKLHVSGLCHTNQRLRIMAARTVVCLERQSPRLWRKNGVRFPPEQLIKYALYSCIKKYFNGYYSYVGLHTINISLQQYLRIVNMTYVQYGRILRHYLTPCVNPMQERPARDITDICREVNIKWPERFFLYHVMRKIQEGTGFTARNIPTYLAMLVSLFNECVRGPSNRIPNEPISKACGVRTCVIKRACQMPFGLALRKEFSIQKQKEYNRIQDKKKRSWLKIEVLE